jgi:signal peptidase I
VRTVGQRDVAGGRSPAGASARAAAPALVGVVLVVRTVLCVAITLWLAALTPALFGMTVSTVMSDSMAPAIAAGDVVVVRPLPASKLRIGEVLLVDDPDRPGRLRLHRLIAERDGSLILRGDANRTADSTPVASQRVRGAAVLRVPLAGLPDYWLRTGAVLPLGLLAGALAALGLIACADIGPPPERDPLVPRRARLARFRRFGRRRAVGARALAVVGVLTAATGALAGGQSWAVFSGIATSSTNTIGAATLFTDCPLRSASLPTPSIYYSYTAATGTSEQDLGGSNTGVVAAGVTRQAGYCDGSAPSPYVSMSNPSAQTLISAGSKIGSPSAAYSVSLWMNPTSSGGILASFADSNGIGSETVSDRRIYYRSDGSLAFGGLYGISGTGSVVFCSTAAPATGTWHHLVGTATAGGILTLYVDGAQACTVTAPNGPAPGAAASGGFWGFGADKSIAGWSDGPSTALVGSLDETTVYPTALTATDVANLYAAGH